MIDAELRGGPADRPTGLDRVQTKGPGSQPARQPVPLTHALRKHWKRLLGLALLCLLITVPAIIAAAIRDSLPGGDAIGYAVVGLLAFLGSASVALPLPGMAVVCGTALALSPPLIGVIAAVAETAGETTGYLAGVTGRAVIEPEGRRWYQRVERPMRRHGLLIIFAVSAIPNPLFDVVGVIAGMMRIPLWRFYLAVLPGKLIKDVVTAYGCAWGIGWIQRMLAG